MSEENITTEAPVEAPATDAGAEPATLGVGDLQNAAQVIDAAVARGAFRASEAAQVGAVYNKITAFIESVAQAQKANEEAEAEA